MSSDLVVFVVGPIVILGVPWLTWLIARRIGARDRRFVWSTAFGVEFILFGLVWFAFTHRWFGVYFAVMGVYNVWMARVIRRTNKNAGTSTPAV